MAAVVAVNAAQLAYKKARKATRQAIKEAKNQPAWLREFANRLPDNNEEPVQEEKPETRLEAKRRELGSSSNPYERCALWIYENITSANWFEAFIFFNIMLIAVGTAMDIENRDHNTGVTLFVGIVSTFTSAVFTAEVVLKLQAEAYKPYRYFIDADQGPWNCFDFFVVVTNFAFMGSSDQGGAVGALRLLRVMRLFTLVKGVPQLKVIILGVLAGLKSVSYILMLLLLVIYMFAIMVTIFFGVNDPARFGTVPLSMLSLFIVSTLAGWTDYAYPNWYGCENYIKTGLYQDENPPLIETSGGRFQGFRCDANTSFPVETFIVFHVFVVLTSWIIMSLFICVVAMGMFQAFEDMKEEMEAQDYVQRLKELGVTGGGQENLPWSDLESAQEKGAVLSKGDQSRLVLKKLLDSALVDDLNEADRQASNYEKFEKTLRFIEQTAVFSNVIVLTIVVVGVLIGTDTDRLATCERFRARGKEENGAESQACDPDPTSVAITILAQLIFTAEAGIKITAYGWSDYIKDSWNRLDFGIVVIGYIEMTPLQSIFENFPVVILRLMRLLRVFRLAKALPRLRSIVEALIDSFGSVGWILLLIAVFNFVVGCGCQLFLSMNDPVHFGTIARSLFTLLRMETGDKWPVIMFISVYGCDQYAYGGLYGESFVQDIECKEPQALGWYGVFVFVVLIIIAKYILPTVLIGIVVISFQESSAKSKMFEEEYVKVGAIVKLVQVEMPHFFTKQRIKRMRGAFDGLDIDGQGSLDSLEIQPVYEYVFFRNLQVEMTPDQREQIFQLMDVDGDGSLGFAEFVTFLHLIKQLQEAAQNSKATRDALDSGRSFREQSLGIESQDGSLDGASSSVQEAVLQALQEKVTADCADALDTAVEVLIHDPVRTNQALKMLDRSMALMELKGDVEAMTQISKRKIAIIKRRPLAPIPGSAVRPRTPMGRVKPNSVVPIHIEADL
mmetsp:Transcript_30215/g.67703  ORF Transcript_30215/g.67703 Transcript_30215/m.67703 type:complete len:957 (+) Transcript_30215:246-3116(+)|eukprot:CAMPEP_0172593124 /NCGR_PEP_ID=MMETSP1068-20121228/12306_1 /TAXON_ID=35684 /ORGANISM="Pseudopedinella elastica, Strain CCMP716" /LENGTH=956 /DNA_ID=CAMNT_0013390513 /DNA_START=215 /DNA_END=3085 /DNA_ORIENTATION=+